MTREQKLLVCLDSAPENICESMALKAAYMLEGTWNGFGRPVATADATGDFLDRWRANDPNGDWGFPTEVGDKLIVTRTEVDEPDVYLKVDEDAQGRALYDLSGLIWLPEHLRGQTG
ncbi:hypothetical protein [Knoellia sinensis]|nr:hypothetical protein [Knoellia sinensis]